MDSAGNNYSKIDGENIPAPTVVIVSGDVPAAYSAQPTASGYPAINHQNQNYYGGIISNSQVTPGTPGTPDAAAANKATPANMNEPIIATPTIVQPKARACEFNCRAIPGSLQSSLICVLILITLEILSTFVVDQINSADVFIEGNQEWEEYVGIGYDSIFVFTTNSNGYAGDRTFEYVNRCGNDDCKFCITINWCTLENKGIEWLFGSYIRLILAGSFIILWFIMVLRIKCRWFNKITNNNSDYELFNNRGNLLTVKELKIKFYNKNKCSMVLLYLCLLLWCLAGLISVYLWNNNNPINNFENVYWSMGLICTCISSAVCMALLIINLSDFHHNHK